MIKYYKLFDLLNRRGMKKSDLTAVISAPTIAKLSKGQNIQTDVIDKICLYLKCQPNDIMEVIEEIVPEENGDQTFIMPVLSKEEQIKSSLEHPVFGDVIDGYELKNIIKDERTAKMFKELIEREYEKLTKK